MLDLLDKFIVLIQLLSAVNFAYIASHFPKKVYRMLFDEKKIRTDNFSAIQQMGLDLQSLGAMTPLTTSDGRSNQDAIISLAERYANLHSRWDTLQQQITIEIDTARSVKGSKCLFLSVSLFGIISLLNIAILTLKYNEFWLMFTLFINAGTLVQVIVLTILMWKHKWSDKEDVHCYKSTLSTSICVFIVAIILSILNWVVVVVSGGWPIIPWIADAILSFCIILPFSPCLISVAYIKCHEYKIDKLTGKRANTLRKEQNQLHSEYEKLCDAEKMFTIPKWSSTHKK